MKSVRVALFVLFSASLVLAAACGGKGSGKSPAVAPTAPASQSTTGGAASQVVDVSRASAAMQELQSFRFDISLKMDLGTPPSGSDASNAFGAALLGALGDITMKGAYVSPDQVQMTMNVLGQKMEYVQIGDQAWVKANGAWTATKPDASAMGFAPSDMFKDFLPSEALRYSKTNRETMNGELTTHYAFDKDAIQKLASEIGGATGSTDLSDITTANLEMWLTNEGVPVKMLMDIAGSSQGQKMSLHMEMNINDLNAKITIKPPV